MFPTWPTSTAVKSNTSFLPLTNGFLFVCECCKGIYSVLFKLPIIFMNIFVPGLDAIKVINSLFVIFLIEYTILPILESV